MMSDWLWWWCDFLPICHKSLKGSFWQSQALYWTKSLRHGRFALCLRPSKVRIRIETFRLAKLAKQSIRSIHADAVVQSCCVLKGARPNHGHASMVAWNLVKALKIMTLASWIWHGSKTSWKVCAMASLATAATYPDTETRFSSFLQIFILVWVFGDFLPLAEKNTRVQVQTGYNILSCIADMIML